MMQEERENVFLVRAILVFVFLCTSIACKLSSTSSSDDCDKEIMSPQTVDIRPFVDLKLPQNASGITEIVKTPMFTQYDIQGSSLSIGYIVMNDAQGGYSDITVSIFEHAGSAMFDGLCKSKWPSPAYENFTIGSEGDTQYCISYVREERADPMGSCEPLGYFLSFVLLQKGNVVVDIYEHTSYKESFTKDEIIRQLVQVIDEWAKQRQNIPGSTEPYITPYP